VLHRGPREPIPRRRVSILAASAEGDQAKAERRYPMELLLIIVILILLFGGGFSFYRR
jgi:hypothetical protein